MRISYVVLHYQNIEVTVECVDYICKIKNEDSSIVIVDNASPNKSGEAIKQMYNSNNDIFVIINNENIGFAKGNNIGYNFAKEHTKAQAIVVMNNDIFIKDEKFEYKLKKYILLSDTEIIAPDILTIDNIHQNPHRIEKLKSRKIIKSLVLYTFTLILTKFLPIRDILIKFMNKYSSSRKKTNEFIDYSMEDIVPHGSCLIYTEKYINKENIAFVPVTFLFSEEDILYDYISMKKYKIMYVPEINVLHLEDASIDYDKNTDVDKFLFNLKYRRNSLSKILLNRLIPFRTKSN